MEYLRQLHKAAQDRDFYSDLRVVDEIPYPEIVIGGKPYLCLCSNNYLGLATHPEVKKAAVEAVERYGIGTCESRWVAGNLKILEELEAAIAEFKKEPAALIFQSGYAANIGIIPAIMDSFEGLGLPTIDNDENLIIKDYLSHISVVDGCRLSRSPTKTFKHNDMNHLEMILKRSQAKRKLILTDGVFSMDGDFAPLPDIVSLARRYGAMVMVDDAHATGIIGENGRGTPEFFHVEGEIDFEMGTMSKALGAMGGFVTGPPDVLGTLRMRSHPFMFSSSLPPEQAAGILAALRIIRNNPGLRDNLWKNVHRFKEGLKQIGFSLSNSETQIIPIIIGDVEKTIRMSRLLFERGILASAISWPAVAANQSRIRCTVIATHTFSQIDRALDIFREVGKESGVI
ncbi:MAG TPA: 8-amino-7-oxononanoate synthase [bacterium]|nr:8-amino-7-oxononanoate synthase [bacterium]